MIIKKKKEKLNYFLFRLIINTNNKKIKKSHIVDVNFYNNS